MFLPLTQWGGPAWGLICPGSVGELGATLNPHQYIYFLLNYPFFTPHHNHHLFFFLSSVFSFQQILFFLHWNLTRRNGFHPIQQNLQAWSSWKLDLLSWLCCVFMCISRAAFALMQDCKFCFGVSPLCTAVRWKLDLICVFILVGIWHGIFIVF